MFRNKNLALSGQGAPLVPFAEQRLFNSDHVFLNLGGISNLGFNGLGFDISICNIALNNLANAFDPKQKFDQDGKLARSGKVDEELLEVLNELPFFKTAHPKSLGIEWFYQNQKIVLQDYIQGDINKIKNAICTFTEHISFQTSQALRSINADGNSVLASGGGAKNLFLMERLQANGIRLEQFENPVWIDFKEAIVFAFLGLQVLLGRPNTLASVTGAKIDALCGSIHLPPSGGFPIFKPR